MYFNTPQFWWFAAFALAVAEYFIPGVFFVFLALAAAITAVLATLGLSIISLQLIIFGILSVVLLFFMRPVWMKFAMGKSPKMGVDALIGKDALVVEEINKPKGRIKIGADSFPAKTINGERVAEGSFVIIKNFEGITCIVEVNHER
ncbi:MAG: NfeD family protein [Brevinema sp.]